MKATHNKAYSTAQVCRFLKIHRDTYYKSRTRMYARESEHKTVLSIIRARRMILPREGGRKLYQGIKPALIEHNIKMGRDKLFNFLRQQNLLVIPKKSYRKTTQSNHWFYKHKNLINDFVPTGPNQLWVSDITYLRLVKGHCYLALITDAYSRKIVGYDISDSLELAGCLRALKRALKALPKQHQLIHHSDRGVQYCSYDYVKALKKNNIHISMTEQNHCYENAMAERVNGILKGEFYLDSCFMNQKMAKKAGKNAIRIYNEHRLHLSLNYKTPSQVHKMTA
ncbi:MAG: IS3 family transposase [Clostridia bacterium]|nr:IS3 family transposase [Clostridia bacterium]